MKKLMLTAAAAALAGVASATNIYDYKASVKYVDFKTVTAKGDSGAKEKVAYKVVKSASLTGYLVTPYDCGCTERKDPLGAGPCERYGMAPSFLVIRNKATDKYSKTYGLSTVKLMPANLLTEWWSTSGSIGTKSLNLKAQGYLFAGVGKRDVPDPIASPFYGLGDFGNDADETKLRTAATQFLFGYYNVVLGDTFIEPFLDHAGFGTAKFTYTSGVDKTDASPCYAGTETPWENGTLCLVGLSGSVIGGSYDCLLNGQNPNTMATVWANCEAYLCQGWDDTIENAISINGVNNLQQEFAQQYAYNVVSGTWSIKANTKIASRCSELLDVVQCAQKIDSNFALGTFDSPSKDPVTIAFPDGIYSTLQTKFVRKWFNNVQ